MSPSSPGLKFSIQIPYASDLAAWTAKVRRAEEAGFYSVSVPDHLGPSLPQLAPLVALAAAATVTENIRLAMTVLDNDFRHPVMLAKEIGTLDLLSGGRVDLGMGAGWLPEDYAKTGVASWDPAKVRVDRLFESVGLVRELMRGEPVTHEGEYYQVKDFTSYPPSVQQPVPLMIGGGGRRMLSFAAQHAQIISTIVRIGGDYDAREKAFEEQLRWIADAGGSERDDLMLGVRVFLGEVVTTDEPRAAIARRVADRMRVSVDEVTRSPFAFVGGLDDVKAHAREINERYGITYFTVSEDMAWTIAPIVAELSA